MNKWVYSHGRVRKISIDIEYLPIIDVNSYHLPKRCFRIEILWYLYRYSWLLAKFYWCTKNWCTKKDRALSRYAYYQIYQYSSYPLLKLGTHWIEIASDDCTESELNWALQQLDSPLWEGCEDFDIHTASWCLEDCKFIRKDTSVAVNISIIVPIYRHEAWYHSTWQILFHIESRK